MESSEFQIPGLGFAKPDDVLPPLPLDPVLAVATDQATTDPEPPRDPSKDAESVDVHSKDADHPMVNSDIPPHAESSAKDESESPPSLTRALEDALGGLEPASHGPPDAEEGQDGDHPEWEVDSSPYESSSELSSDSSSDEESDNEAYELLGVEETARVLMEMEGGSDAEDERGDAKELGHSHVRTKNEIPDEIIPRPDVSITPEMKIEELGVVERIVETTVLIKAFTPGEYQVLDRGSVLCTGDRVVLAAVAETLGTVLQPRYTVQFATNNELKESGMEAGLKIFYSLDHASYVFTQPLKNMRGSDASNIHDEEVGADELEFSDDEREAEHRRGLKKKGGGSKWKKAERGNRQPHPLRHEISQGEAKPEAKPELNYDDEDDGPYKPLTRPANFGQGPPPPEEVLMSETFNRQNIRGGRRPDARGRGGRGDRRGDRSHGRGRGGGGFGRRDDPGFASQRPQDHQQTYPNQQQGLSQSQWAGSPFQQTSPVASHYLQQGAALPSGFKFSLLPGWQESSQPVVPPPAQVPVPSPQNAWPTGQFPPAPPPPNAGVAPTGGAYFNPAFFQNLLSQVQAQAQNQQQGQWPPHPPP